MTNTTNATNDPTALFKRLGKIDGEIVRQQQIIKRVVDQHRAQHKRMTDERAIIRQQIDTALSALDRVAGMKPAATPVSNGHVAEPKTVEPIDQDPDTAPWNGQRVRRVQALLGLDNEGFARRAGVSAATIVNWRNDETTPYPRNILALVELEREAKAVSV